MKHNRLPSSTFASPIAAVFTLGLIVVLAGCALRSRESITYHVFDYPTPAREYKPPIPDTLMVYRFLPASSVDTESLVVTRSSEAKQSATLHRWKEDPADMITDLVVRDLENSGLFEKTVDQLSTVRYRYALEATIRKLQGIITEDKAKALLEVKATLTDFEAPAGTEKYLLKKLYKIEVPSRDTTPNSIIKALDLAVKELSEGLQADIRVALESKVRDRKKSVPRHRPVRRSRI